MEMDLHRLLRAAENYGKSPRKMFEVVWKRRSKGFRVEEEKRKKSKREEVCAYILFLDHF